MKIDQKIWAGFCLWVGAILWLRPSLQHENWGAIILLFALLVLFPLALPSLQKLYNAPLLQTILRLVATLQFPAACCALISFGLPQGISAALFVLPWVGVTALIALVGFLRCWQTGFSSHAEFCLNAGCMYFSVGGGWLLMARSGAQPLGFGATIVLLTAIHFHYAGFILPLLAGNAAQKIATKFAQRAALFVLLGVPLTAVGITVTQIFSNHTIETCAAFFMALAGWMSALLFWQMATHTTTAQAKFGWRAAAIFLSGGMLLAMMYSLRFLTPLPLLDIPLMRALHGTANSLGFALCGVLALRNHDAA